MELENIILSEVTQTQKDKYHMYSLFSKNWNEICGHRWHKWLTVRFIFWNSEISKSGYLNLPIDEKHVMYDVDVNS